MNRHAYILAAIALPTAAWAASPLQVTTQVMVEQRVAAHDGSTSLKLVPPRRVVPGDRVTLVISYRNTGASPLGNVVLANPVPRGMAYRAAAPGTPAPEVSVDGRSYGALAALKVRGTDGASRAATAADVVAVRWRLANPVPAGAEGRLAFQAVLN